MRKTLLFIAVLLSSWSHAQEQPKLVVGIVVDQMRADYIQRFWNRYSENGFKKLVNGGFNCANTHYNYVPTYTGPGHASVYTGTTPAVHGIIANHWYDKKEAKDLIYCVGDDKETTVGASTVAGQMSSKNLLVSTIGDQLKLSNGIGSKVYGVALKDRAAILPAGHSADGAYWLDSESGNWVTSTQYQSALPNWLTALNDSKRVDGLLKTWNTLYPIDTYVASLPDDNPYEEGFDGKPVFPYDLEKLKVDKGLGLIKATPFGNTATREVAEAIIANEQLGKDLATDLIAISFSATDYVGHQFGPHSIELEDTYLRLDRDLATLFAFLDKQVGEGEYTVFLTADHGAVEVPSYLMDNNIPGGYINKPLLVSKLKAVGHAYGDTALVENVSNYQVFIDWGLAAKLNIKEVDFLEDLKKVLMGEEGMSIAYTRSQMEAGYSANPNFSRLQLGFHQQRSGDVLYAYSPGWITYDSTGTTHGSTYSYDTHVPLLWYGAGVTRGKSYDRFEITDVAATVSAILGIEYPNGCIGQPIGVAIKQD